ncbi:glycosyltransferase family 4 protein [Aureivirga sp. CE67]|uniref:glycosyltransferase family 4 protein n=1 Tax=Aureivirga sp. CE67 TaxID=1788983 RepID=UPI0018C9D6AE|nr:glycosyltransferase family 4 protein [Aureivirga sp. CE67]
MRIGMILDNTFPPDPRVENEAVSLIKKGFEVCLFALKYDEKEADFEIVNKIQVYRYTSTKLNYKLSALAYTVPFYSKIMSKKIEHFLKETRVDAIHIHDMRIAEAVLMANKKNLPTVLDLHDNMPEVMKFYPHLQKFPGKYIISPKKWKQKEEMFIRKATKVITVSQEFIDEVVQRVKIPTSKIELVPNTVRRSFYQKAEINHDLVEKYRNDFVLLYLGDTGLRRGLQTAIAAIPKLKNVIPNIKLVIVGTNTTDYVLKQQVEELGIEKYVDFQGWQNVKLFPSYIMASNICISPLNRNIQHDVAYANKLFQYMSLGKPVLVSDAIAQKRLVERTKTGLVHKERNPDSFADGVLKLYEYPELCKIYGINGKFFIENEFCWEKTSEKLIELYKNLDPNS